jgi:hypothetical protein
MIGLVAALAAAVALVACSEQPASGVYGSHLYSCCSEVTANTIWHPGQRLTLHWTAEPPGVTTNATPHQVTLKLGLTGPYPTVEALKQATSQGTTPAGVRTVNAAPVTVNDRTVETPVSTLNLPADLAAGYYNLDTESISSGNSTGGGAVVMIAP